MDSGRWAIDQALRHLHRTAFGAVQVSTLEGQPTVMKRRGIAVGCRRPFAPLCVPEVKRRGIAALCQVLLLCSRATKPLSLGMGYVQADSRARFSHCSTFTPLIKSHK